VILLYWLWRLGIFLTRVLPRGWSLAAAGWLGAAAYARMSERRRTAQNNFSHVLQQPAHAADVDRVARESFRNYARLLREVMLYSRLTHAGIGARVTVTHPEHFEAAFARGKGIILVSAHYGNMDLAAAVLATRYTPITLVSETLQPRALFDYIVKMRARNHIKMYEYAYAPRKMLDALRHNEMIGLLLDIGTTHHFDMTTTDIEFFGARTRLTTGPAQIAYLTGAPIIVGAGFVESDTRVRLETFAPIFAEPTGNRQHDIKVLLQEIGTRLEQFIHAQPEQWYIFRPMWQTGYNADR